MADRHIEREHIGEAIAHAVALVTFCGDFLMADNIEEAGEMINEVKSQYAQRYLDLMKSGQVGSKEHKHVAQMLAGCCRVSDEIQRSIELVMEPESLANLANGKEGVKKSYERTAEFLAEQLKRRGIEP